MTAATPIEPYIDTFAEHAGTKPPCRQFRKIIAKFTCKTLDQKRFSINKRALR